MDGWGILRVGCCLNRNKGHGVQNRGLQDKEGPSEAIEREVEGIKAEHGEGRDSFFVPAMIVLCNPGMKLRHWKVVSEIVGRKIIPDTSTTFKDIIELKVHEFTDDIAPISSKATRELGLERALKKMKEEWQDIEFATLPHRDSDTFVLCSLDDIQTLLDDNIVKTQAMRSPLLSHLRQKLNGWYDDDDIDDFNG
ncbi:dynein heavy chain 3, axonemal [Caerostris extrusa]|uniref:Dynein heavy chain 3, axonemal n=1 Tax=Caerostris extrusa TaxID=172846 RepID=A0AAV4XKJ9_CAEEX|nr:dynein heavy chain 3, axonemal [Caerostris extrusa]